MGLGHGGFRAGHFDENVGLITGKDGAAKGVVGARGLGGGDTAQGRDDIGAQSRSRARGAESLFTTADGDTFPAKRSREQFEKYIVPFFTCILFLLQAAAAYWPWTLISKMDPLKTDRATLAIAFVGLFFIVLFLIGKYSSGLARLQGQRLLRAGSSYELLAAYAAALIAISIGAVLAGFPKIDLLVGQVLCIVVGLAIAVGLVIVVRAQSGRRRGQGNKNRGAE